LGHAIGIALNQDHKLMKAARIKEWRMIFADYTRGGAEQVLARRAAALPGASPLSLNLPAV
jgi:hypothetical protein